MGHARCFAGRLRSSSVCLWRKGSLTHSWEDSIINDRELAAEKEAAGGDKEELVLVFAIYALIIVCAIYGLIISIRLFGYSAKFKQAAEKLKGEQTQQQIREWLCGDSGAVSLFADPKLDQTLEEYANAYQKNRGTEGAAPFVDMTEYFNREYLDEIGSTGMSNVIPGILTGFGILGTFIGLISGISGFDTVSSEVIMGSITNLLGGMEDAFGTSICGVVYSLAFSILYKAGYESANKQMENFAAAFHSAGLDSSEKTTEIQLLHYQQQQTEQIQNLSVVILKAISDTMKTELIPIFSDMQQSMREYICHAGQQQKESLDQIVHEFIRQMIRSLKGQFDALAETLDRTEKCQSHALVQMQKIVDGVITSSDQLKQINEDSRRTVEQMKNYSQLLLQCQQKINDAIGEMQRQIETSCTLNQQQAAYIQTLEASEERLGNLTGYIKQEADTVWNMADKISNHCKDQMGQLSQAADTSLHQLSQEAAVGLGQVSRAMTVSLEQILKAASADLKQLADSAEKKITDISQLSGKAAADLDTAAGEIKQTAEQLHKTFGDTLAGISATLEQNLSDAAQRLNGTAGNLSAVVEAIPKVISQTQTEYQEAMDRQTREYVHAMQEMTEKVQAAAQLLAVNPAQNDIPNGVQEKADRV